MLIDTFSNIFDLFSVFSFSDQPESDPDQPWACSLLSTKIVSFVFLSSRVKMQKVEKMNTL